MSISTACKCPLYVERVYFLPPPAAGNHSSSGCSLKYAVAHSDSIFLRIRAGLPATATNGGTDCGEGKD
jgi:hypothetical protein